MYNVHNYVVCIGEAHLHCNLSRLCPVEKESAREKQTIEMARFNYVNPLWAVKIDTYVLDL